MDVRFSDGAAKLAQIDGVPAGDLEVAYLQGPNSHRGDPRRDLQQRQGAGTKGLLAGAAPVVRRIRKGNSQRPMQAPGGDRQAIRLCYSHNSSFSSAIVYRNNAG